RELVGIGASVQFVQVGLGAGGLLLSCLNAADLGRSRRVVGHHRLLDGGLGAVHSCLGLHVVVAVLLFLAVIQLEMGFLASGWVDDGVRIFTGLLRVVPI